VLKVFWLFLAALMAGCTNTGVKNSADFATSLNDLAKREVLSNLEKVFDEGATFVPSHVFVSTGKSTTAASVTPSFVVPLGPGYSNTVVPTGNNQYTGVTTFAAATVSLGGNVALTQEWTMMPATDADALMRLRTLYLYVTAQMSDDFLCNYPVQRQRITVLDNAANDKNIAYRAACRPEATFYADPNFVVLPNCIVCVTSNGLAERAKRVRKAGTNTPAKVEAEVFVPGEVIVNSRLLHGIVYRRPHLGVEISARHGAPHPGERDLSSELAPASTRQTLNLNPPLIPFPGDTRVYLRNGNDQAFRDFILFTYAAMAQTGQTTGGK
jgi:hypothetical protein